MPAAERTRGGDQQLVEDVDGQDFVVRRSRRRPTRGCLRARDLAGTTRSRASSASPGHTPGYGCRHIDHHLGNALDT